MGEYIINGRKRLEGEVTVSGGKNAVLPILAATVLTEGINVICNCPRISDVETAVKILETVGCKVKWEKSTLLVDSSGINNYIVPEELVKEMRSSIFFLGSILGRLRKAKITSPGGCTIGERPIGFHLKALRELGVVITEENRYINCDVTELKGADINLDYPSVGATENIMLAAALAKGSTTIINAAREPEIIDLQNFLNKCGAKVFGAGTGTITIEGVKKLSGAEHRVIPDRIEAGTFLTAVAITGGEVLLKKMQSYLMLPVIYKLKECGCTITDLKNEIYLKAPKKLVAIDTIYTHPHPGYPTDMQPQIMSLLTLAKGTSIIIETVFESRYKHVPELNVMGANIQTDGRVAVIKGVNKLHGSCVSATDLRAGAALIVAGLAAEGETKVLNAYHIERGYENIQNKLSSLGADIKFINKPEGERG